MLKSSFFSQIKPKHWVHLTDENENGDQGAADLPGVGGESWLRPPASRATVSHKFSVPRCGWGPGTQRLTVGLWAGCWQGREGKGHTHPALWG